MGANAPEAKRIKFFEKRIETQLNNNLEQRQNHRRWSRPTLGISRGSQSYDLIIASGAKAIMRLLSNTLVESKLNFVQKRVGQMSHQRTKLKFGFTLIFLVRSKSTFGLRLSELAWAEFNKCKFEGVYGAKWPSRASVNFNIKTLKGLITTSHNNCSRLQMGDGYDWSFSVFSD
ncbi:MAG: hypothetical protein LBV23_11040 [Deltaproteobacteria bacterium]|nr:hypothetical protein [Deltaproteobacteria bacterium]